MKASECSSITEIRTEIDQIDRSIVALISQRSQYVAAAAAFKSSAASVKAEDRVLAMIEARRSWAIENGVDADIVEAIFRSITDSFIKHEMKLFEQSQVNKR